ncbi:MAG: SLC13 family permease [Phycisphaerales bacterium JB039]
MRRWTGGAIAVLAGGLIGATDLAAGLGLDEAQRVALAIVIIAGTLWITEAIPIYTTSLLVLLLSLVWLRPAMAEAPPPSAFTEPFFSDVILLFLGGFVLAAALRKYRIDEILARGVIRRSGASVPRLMAGVLLITAFLSMWLSNTATAAMMLTLVYPILRLLPNNPNARRALVLCVPFGANIGGLGTPIGSPPNAIAMQYLRGIGHAPGFVTWIAMSWPVMLVMLVAAWALLISLFGGRGARIDELPEQQPVELSGQSYLAIGVTLLTVAGWLTGDLHGFSTGTVALVPVIVLFGAGVLNRQDFRTLSWDILILMGGGLCLGVTMGASGLAEWLVAQIPADAVGMVGLIAIIAVVACVMSSLMSNTATANLLMPIAIGVAAGDPSLALVSIAFACSLAMALPISTPPNAIAFGSGEISTADMFKSGLALTAAGVVLVVVASALWWPIFPAMQPGGGP